MLLNRNVIKSNNIFFEGNSSYGPNTQRSMEYLCTWSMQYVLLLFHIVLKFTLCSWQVPRSSVGRALYRESGPSQDGDPVPGNLPFFFFYLFFPFFTILKSNAKSPCIPLFSFQKESQHCSAINQRDPFMVSYLWLCSTAFSAFIQGILFLAQDQSVQSKACKIGP